MTLKEAINVRCSNRKYLNTPIPQNKVQKMEELINRYNKEADLNMQLILNNGKAFAGLKRSYGMFSGVNNYIAVVGKTDDFSKERAGYYGEKLVLEATCLNLGTCWVGTCFDKKSCVCFVNQDEEIYCLIVLGQVADKFSLKEKIISKAMHRKTKSFNEIVEADTTELPNWFKNGIYAVQKAPSALNQQPVKFIYQSGTVRARVSDKSPYGPIDMGIAKLHFELGAEGGYWEFGNNAEYHRTE
ncbi:nitroreductase family protein [Thermoanaerobacterium sp. RBIITD]|uniref:nitroreductase family protein n=1 Tax=Thermoanaerobacterium sp. RBIITD TaxID=1550240 RepID=UPI000BB78A16|nr:nitroreductase family protein [Thermoanaerobacterium sp. RBIITD]SNX53731.1 hypothetical protein SAMN05660242_1309 [Thermoanaerobacterium sp. RBIITD]